MIYPLDQAIENLIINLTDEDTGELKCSDEELAAAMADLEMDFDKKIVALRNSYMDINLQSKRVAADAKVLRDEAASVQKRANTLQNKAERIRRFIAYLLQGEKFEKEGVKITYRKSEECVIDNDFCLWAIENMPALLDFKPRKQDIAEALKHGIDIPNAHIEERSNIQIK